MRLAGITQRCTNNLGKMAKSKKGRKKQSGASASDAILSFDVCFLHSASNSCHLWRMLPSLLFGMIPALNIFSCSGSLITGRLFSGMITLCASKSISDPNHLWSFCSQRTKWEGWSKLKGLWGKECSVWMRWLISALCSALLGLRTNSGTFGLQPEKKVHSLNSTVYCRIQFIPFSICLQQISKTNHKYRKDFLIFHYMCSFLKSNDFLMLENEIPSCMWASIDFTKDTASGTAARYNPVVFSYFIPKIQR